MFVGGSMKFEEAKVTSKWRITIPKSIRIMLGLKTGKSALLIPEGNGVIIKPKVKNSLKI